ncbi:filamentous hemagglutinin N-terminal domain-containing protein [Mixta calida]|uniref:filamentous hemagglutinin N-terminal domain-containing protein n=1 Tax=Mixta calida TaxID=665913 RepID=UPI002908D9C1|nr:filamentous hemagglutinin N-terminal domain-containing protein [Mixta calida]MDU6536237.1 filamentous hemagglutinin N-terminal domain-containing protein [Mixta calida]
MKKNTMLGLVKFNPIAASILLALPIVTQAVTPSTRGTNVNQVNGVTVIDIDTANAKGISHNIYGSLSVDKNGLIFNNSNTSVNTSLAGQINGNSNLTSGSAKVIVNEVTTTSKSHLNGILEVAGSKAHLIIANPNGISCQGCGFINTDKVTITTGKPDMQNGELKGYSVNGGIINVNGLGSDSPTEILARSVATSGLVIAPSLSVVAGSNYVDTTGNVTGSVKAQGSRNQYSIDVANIGGMYADRISLVSTDKGIGVRNSGVIAGSSSVQINSNGKLVNNNAQITSGMNVDIKTSEMLENVTGKISSDGDISINTNRKTINNSRAGNIISSGNINIDSGALDNTNGKMAASEKLEINTNNNKLINYGKGERVGINAGAVVLNTGVLDNRDGSLKGYNISANSSGINNTHGIIEASGNIDLVSNLDIYNTEGRIRTATGHIKIDASKGIFNNNKTRTADYTSEDTLGVAAGEGGAEIKAITVNNQSGQIGSNGTISFISTGKVDNFKGKLSAEKGLTIKAKNFSNGQAGTSVNGNVTIDLTGEFANNIGIFSARNGDISLKANYVNNSGAVLEGRNVNIEAKDWVNNKDALLVAHQKLVINAVNHIDNSNGEYFGHDYGIYLGMMNQPGGLDGKGGVEIHTRSINNNHSRIVAESGSLDMVIGEAVHNSHAMIVSKAGAPVNIKAQSIHNNYSTISSNGALNIETGFLSNSGSGTMIDNNATGIISSVDDLRLTVGQSFTNYGWINSKKDAYINVNGTLSNSNTINADGSLFINGTSVNNYRSMSAGNRLEAKSDSYIDNFGNMNAAVMALDAKGSIGNLGVILGRSALTTNARNIYNYATMTSYGF